MNTPIHNKKIAIIGGGPGGLTLARLLQMNGADVKVYERDLNRDVRVQGATLDLHEESGLAALRAAGLMDAFIASYRPGADKMRITGKEAKILCEDGFAGTEDKPLRPEIDRGPLREILLDSLQAGTVVWNSNFVSLTRQDGSVTIEFKNGSTVQADIVIAADGANSRIRPYITPIKPFYTGLTGVEGAVYHSEQACPAIHELLDGGKIFALADGKTLIVASKGDGSLVFYTTSHTSENWAKDSGINFSDKAQVFKWFKETFKGWDGIWDELFINAEPVFIPRPMYCMPLDQTWETLPNLTMLGDAAHLMPPFAGEGVNMAMLDALQLSEALTDPAFTDIRSAIAHYEKQMLARFAKIGQGTLYNTEWMHAPDALNDMLAMFGKNKFKQGLFMAKYFVRGSFMPFIRKVTGLGLKPDSLSEMHP